MQVILTRDLFKRSQSGRQLCDQRLALRFQPNLANGTSRLEEGDYITAAHSCLILTRKGPYCEAEVGKISQRPLG